MKAETAWKWMPATVLLLTVLFAVWRLQLALDDPHFAVVEHSYEKGINWDQHLAMVEASRALGWRVELAPGPATHGGDSTCILTATGPDGEPLEALTGEVSAFHNAYPRDARTAALTARGRGRYSFSMPLRRSGLWQWRVRLERGGSTWIGTLRRRVTASGGGR